MGLNKDIQDSLYRSQRLCKIFVVFLAILSISLLLSLIYIQRNSFTKKLERFPLLDPTRNLLEKKDAINNLQPIRDYLNSLAVREASSSTVSIYFEFLNTGANVSVNNGEKIWPVSWAKLPLAMVAMKKVEDGEWSESQRLQILDEDVDSSSGELFKQNLEQGVSVSGLIKEMLTNSDNTAYRVLKRNTTDQDRQEISDDVGLGELFTENGKVSAKEYSRLFRSLYTASYLNQENSQKILKLMTQNNFKEFLNQGMPEEVLFSHKQGENVKLNVYADSGIVYLEHRPYIFSIMIQPKLVNGSEGKQYAKEIMKETASEVYHYIKNK